MTTTTTTTTTTATTAPVPSSGPPSPLRITRSASFSGGLSFAAYRRTRALASQSSAAGSLVAMDEQLDSSVKPRKTPPALTTNSPPHTQLTIVPSTDFPSFRIARSPSLPIKTPSASKDGMTNVPLESKHAHGDSSIRFGDSSESASTLTNGSSLLEAYLLQLPHPDPVQDNMNVSPILDSVEVPAAAGPHVVSPPSSPELETIPPELHIEIPHSSPTSDTTPRQPSRTHHQNILPNHQVIQSPQIYVDSRHSFDSPALRKAIEGLSVRPFYAHPDTS
ncbi:hypothetical protein BCR33DRAFT_389352 [Rhizoclosmatium globosum]|uniref:Uncharacterized protein n=1 Tax=Rhizoclosmatium globosum TaxID=329046 RepID=A0A1Y2BXL3_9FUNG|nr:hypothetical protein BCR33DRAFT_389352 [Rhizoclosmatium globosum]|eukprot:ORY39488.1 hypothetical protein BCR33DRAFT_389352 [Rhizoclosmatium globosum]